MIQPAVIAGRQLLEFELLDEFELELLELLLDEFELELLELLLDEFELELLELLLDEFELELELLFELVPMRGRPSLKPGAGLQAAVVPMIAAAASAAEATRRRAR